MEEQIQPAGAKKSLFKRLARVLAWLCGSVLALIVALLVLLLVYEDEAKAAIIAGLNRHLKAEVKIDPKNIDLTIIKTFPDCSIEFKNVLVLEALPLKQRDTLLFAGVINLHFNIRDLWNGQYAIHKIKMKDGVAKLRVLKSGEVNYLFWKQDKTAPAGGSTLAFALESFSIGQFRITYSNAPAEFKTALLVQSIDLKGNFGATDFVLASKGRLLIHTLAQQKQVYLKDKRCDFSVGLDVHGNKYTISQANVQLNKLLLDLNGSFVYNDGFRDLNLAFTAPSLDIASLISLLPGKFKTGFADYESAGNFYAKGAVTYKATNDFALNAEFGVKNGSITYKPGGMTAKHVQLDGRLEYSNTGSELSVRNVGLALNNDVLNGSCLIRNFKDPYLELSVQAGLHLENLKAFLPLDTLSRLKGSLSMRTTIKGLWRDVREQTFSPKVVIELDAHASNLEAQFKGDAQVFAVENCSVLAVNREIEVKDLKLKRGSSDVLLNGKLPGFFNYLAGDKSPLVITGNLYSESIKLEDFMVKYRASGGEGPLIPPNVIFKLNAAILKFSYAKFEARAITGEIEIKNQKAIISDMKLDAMDGEAIVDAFADNSQGRLEVVLQSKLKNINISRLFREFNNFGQSTLQDKHLKGYASADVDFSGSWSNRLEPNLGSIQAVCNLNIERGELLEFKPLMSLARFVDIQDLQRIKFAALQSTIRIADKTITFPKTVLRNSALNLSLWGSHRFDNHIDYHLQLLISELLAKKRKKRNEDFGPVEHDAENRRSAFILMTGTVDDPIIKYDRKGLQEKVKEDLKEEKQNIRRILKEEFGSFKKDPEKKSQQSSPAFELEKPGNNPPKKTLEPKKKEEDEDF